MKKRIWSALLALCLMLSLLPTTALAGGTGLGWDAFKADAANPGSNHLALSDYTLFQWPSDEQTLTLAAQLSVRRGGMDNCTIPANITTHFVQNGAISLVSGATLTLNGPVTADEDINFRPMAVLADGRATVELNNSCYVTRTDGSLGRTYITKNYTWNLNENGALGEVYLTGKLVGRGGTAHTVSVIPEHAVSAGELGGTLKLTKLNVGLSSEANASLTIPEGAKITVADSAENAHDGKFYLPAGSTLYLNGELTIETGSNRFNGTIVLGKNGKLILKHQYPFTKSNGEEGKITGEGTLQYVQKNTYLFGNTTDSKLSDINADRENGGTKYDELVSISVKIERLTNSSSDTGTTLPAPTELAWGKYWYEEEDTQRYFESSGMISWKYPEGVSRTDLALVRVYRVGTGEDGGDEQVWHSYWKAAAGKYWTDWDFSLDGIYGETENMGEFTKADYYFTVQMVDQRENPTKVSTEVKSENWHYECPDQCLGTPTASVSGSYVVSHTPADVDNDCNGGFQVVVYRSADRVANPTIFKLFSSYMKGEADRLFAWVRYLGEPSYSDTLDISELLAGEDPGWCYAVVSTVSSDINAISHTGDGRVVEFYYDGNSSGATCQHTNTELKNYKAATCGEDGYSGDVWCKDCERTVTAGQTVSATGKHTSNNETDCTKAEVCTECGAVLRAAGSHSFGAWSKQDDTYHAHVCVTCGKPETAPHSWDEGSVTTPPTQESDGVKTFTCADCFGTKTEPISRLKTQDVKWTVPSVNWTYGAVGSVNNAAYNDSEGGGALSYASSNTAVATVNEQGRVTIVGAGTAVITATAAAVPGRYVESSAEFTLTVEKATLSITAKDKTISYGQAPANDGYAVSGLVNGDSESVIAGAAVYSYSYEQFGRVGTYTIELSGLTANNYDITFQPGTLTVEKTSNYTITLGKLEQTAGHTSAVTASVEPYDATAEVKLEYQVENVWTAAVPSEAGSYAVRACLTASDNISFAADTYTPATLLVRSGVTVDNGSQSGAAEVGVTVDGGKASLSIEDPGQLAGSAAGDVSINIGGVSGAKELELPGGLLSGLSENTDAGSLSVSTEDASVKLSGEVIDTVAEAVKSGEDSVTLRLTAVDKSELNDEQQAALESIGSEAVIVEVKLVISHAEGGETELHELGGDTEITVPYGGPVPEGRYVVVTYVSNDGSVSYIRASYDRETKQVSFRTSHFSHYVVDVSRQNTYDVIVNGGSGSGTYLEGSTVTVSAESRSGYTFAGWTVESGAVELANASAAQTSFVMPAENVSLRAEYTPVSFGGGSGSGGSSAAEPEEPEKPENPFVDVAEGCYYESAVLWAVEKGITTGVEDDRFGPELSCTRAQIVTFLWRAAGSPEPKSAANPFVDVSNEAYYAKAVLWAVEQGITTGVEDDRFGPEQSCTRAQTVTFLFRYAAAQGMSAVTLQELVSGFSDAAQIPAYALPAFNWALAGGVVEGAGDVLMPGAECTRAQIVTMLYRLLVK